MIVNVFCSIRSAEKWTILDLFAQYGGQEGHSDVHAVLRLTEVRCPGVRIHLHTERRGEKKYIYKKQFKWHLCDFFKLKCSKYINLYFTSHFPKSKVKMFHLPPWLLMICGSDLISLTLGIGCITTIFFLATVIMWGVRMNWPKHWEN